MENQEQYKFLDINGVAVFKAELEKVIDVSKEDAKDYADEKIADLVNSAPETLDTLGELAIAFQENENVIDILDDAITEKADKTDLQTLQENVNANTTDVSNLKSQILSNSLIIADAITGDLYTIQIQNGQLVSFSAEEVVTE